MNATKVAQNQHKLNSKYTSFQRNKRIWRAKINIMNEFSFQMGYSQVRQKDVSMVKERIMSSLGITTRSSWLARLNGTVEPKVSEAKAIESIFASYGINKVWGARE